jgi:hypothetical protein
MEERDIKHQFHLLQKEVAVTVSLTEEIKLNLVAGIDALKIEVASLKRLMERSDTDFARQYSEGKEEVLRDVDLERLDRNEGSNKR